jgi:hypothetical protein
MQSLVRKTMYICGNTASVNQRVKQQRGKEGSLRCLKQEHACESLNRLI